MAVVELESSNTLFKDIRDVLQQQGDDTTILLPATNNNIAVIPLEITNNNINIKVKDGGICGCTYMGAAYTNALKVNGQYMKMQGLKLTNGSTGITSINGLVLGGPRSQSGYYSADRCSFKDITVSGFTGDGIQVNHSVLGNWENIQSIYNNRGMTFLGDTDCGLHYFSGYCDLRNTTVNLYIGENVFGIHSGSVITCQAAQKGLEIRGRKCELKLFLESNSSIGCELTATALGNYIKFIHLQSTATPYSNVNTSNSFDFRTLGSGELSFAGHNRSITYGPSLSYMPYEVRNTDTNYSYFASQILNGVTERTGISASRTDTAPDYSSFTAFLPGIRSNNSFNWSFKNMSGTYDITLIEGTDCTISSPYGDYIEVRPETMVNMRGVIGSSGYTLYYINEEDLTLPS